MHGHLTPEEVARFWSKVDCSGGPDSCWPWLAKSRHAHGYGHICFRGRREPLIQFDAHRLAWLLVNGDIPEGMCVCHDCPDGDNPACCNPAHLFLASSADNIKDMWRKGRGSPPPIMRGEMSAVGRLTEADVRAIRDTYAQGDVTFTSLANQYGVTIRSIALVVRRLTWSHVV